MSDDEAKDPKGSDDRDDAATDTSESTSETTPSESSESSTPAKPSRRKRRSKSATKTTAAAPASATASVGGTGSSADDKKPDSKDSKDGPAEGDDEAQRRDLPKWNRARVKRKAPAGEEQDAFQTSVRKAGRGILQRPAAVIGIIVGVAAIGAGAYAWTQKSAADEAVATDILATAAAYEARGEVVEDLDTLVGERTRPLPLPLVKTDDELRTTVDGALTDLETKASGSDANIVADLVRAARLARASDFEGAEKAYRGFIKTQPGHRLVFMAREGLIISLEAQGRYDDALTEVASIEGEAGDFFRDQALWHKGRLLEAAQRGDEALDVYKQYMDEYPFDEPSLASDAVRARLEQLDPASVPAVAAPGPGGLGGLGGLGQ